MGSPRIPSQNDLHTKYKPTMISYIMTFNMITIKYTQYTLGVQLVIKVGSTEAAHTSHY